MSQFFDESGKVICQECLKSFDVITPAHLKKHHTMTMEEYKKKYENSPLVSEQSSARRKMRNKEIFSNDMNNSKDNPIDLIYEVKIEDLNTDKIVDKNFTKKVSSFIDEVKELSEIKNDVEYPNPTGIIHKDKLNILNCLLKYFDIKDIKNSFFIEKVNLSGHLEYKLITDICIPRIKVVLDFPNTFWHNRDIVKHSKDTILKMDGWIIIDFKSARPSIEEVKKTLKDLNLI